MTRIKYLAGGIAATLALAALSGCSSSSQPTSSAGPVTLSMLATNTYKPAVDSLIKEFEASNQDTTIDVSYTDDNSVLSTLPQQLAAGNAPDIFTIWPGTYSPVAAGELAKRGFVLDLSKEAWVKSVPKTMADFVGLKGKTYFPPLVSLPILSMYNQSALDKAGLSVPATWDDVLQLCKEAKSAGVFAYALGAQTQSQNQMLPFTLVPTLVDGPDPSFMADRADGKATFADSPWLDAFKQMKEMNDAGCFSSPLGTDVDTAQGQVAAGQALGMFGPSSYFGIVQKKIGDSSTLVAAAVPATNDADDTRLALALGSSFGVNAKTRYPDQAKAFIDFLMQPKNVVAYAEASGQPPALPNDEYKPSDATELAVEMTKDGKTSPVPDQLFPSPEIRTAWITTTQEMLGGSATPADVVKAMDDAWAGSK